MQQNFLFVVNVIKRKWCGRNGAQEVMCDEVESVKGFRYLGDKLKASGECEAAVTTRTRVGWKKFRECSEILFGKRFSLQMKGKIYKHYVR